MKDEIEVLMHGDHKRHHEPAADERQHKTYLLDQLARESDDSEPEGETPLVRRLLSGMTGVAVGSVVVGLFIMLWAVCQHLFGW
jgi:hypothetical protein